MVTSRNGMLYDKVSVIASGNTIDFHVSHAAALAIKEILSQLYSGTYPGQKSVESESVFAGFDAAPPVPHPAPAGQDNAVAQLAKLGELKDACVITEAEFESKKAEPLRRI